MALFRRRRAVRLRKTWLGRNGSRVIPPLSLSVSHNSRSARRNHRRPANDSRPNKGS